MWRLSSFAGDHVVVVLHNQFTLIDALLLTDNHQFYTKILVSMCKQSKLILGTISIENANNPLKIFLKCLRSSENIENT